MIEKGFQMQTIKIHFTKRAWNPVSMGIRLAVPESITTPARASHCLIEDGEHFIEARMIKGVVRPGRAEALQGSVVVAVREYAVPDASAGLLWARSQIGRPYDYAGAFGLGVAPGRDWQEDDAWFCFELAAACLTRAGLDIFAHTGRISGNTLLQLQPRLQFAYA